VADLLALRDRRRIRRRRIHATHTVIWCS
jgi:hypothetical protein